MTRFLKTGVWTALTAFLLFLSANAPAVQFGENAIQTDLRCPVCEYEFSGPALSETFFLASPGRKLFEDEEHAAGAIDGFYCLLFLRDCPRCGLILPDAFHRNLPASPDAGKFVARLSEYLHSDEFTKGDRGGPPMFRFARVIERMDPKALVDNPLQHFFLGFWYAAGAWQAEGNALPESVPEAKGGYFPFCLEESIRRFETGLEQSRADASSLMVFPHVLLQAGYMKADAQRKLGRFNLASDALKEFRQVAEGAEPGTPMDPEMVLRLEDLNRMADHLEELIRAEDRETRIRLRDYLEIIE